MLNVIEPRCEYLKDPVGIGEKKPRFSWRMEADGRDVTQKSYQLQISQNNNFDVLLWDTGIIYTDASRFIEYAGPMLKSRTRYYYRVKITDDHERKSDWSRPAFFETGLLDSDLWKAKFISAEDADEADKSEGKLLRKEFYVKAGIRSARVYITALGMYELYINGCRAGEYLFTPGWTSYSKRLQYQTYDVTALIKGGQNAIGAVTGAGWYKGDLAGWLGKRNLYGNRTALLLQLHIEYDDGTEQVLISDKGWKTSCGPVIYSELYHGETYDARLEKPGWDKPDYDDPSWTAAEEIDFDMTAVVAQDGLPVKKQEILKPVSVFTTPKGEKVIDFGQNMSGWVKFSVKGSRGDKVVLKHAEVLDAEGNFYTKNLRSAKARIEYILKGDGTETYEPHFTFQGFRYVMIEEYPGEFLKGSFEAVAIYSDMEYTGEFECSNELVNRLNNNIIWGLKGNFVDIPTDCPQRDERLGWTGDAQVFIRTACYIMQTGVFFRKWLRDLKADQINDGGVPYVIPDVLTGKGMKTNPSTDDHSACGWGDAAVICPWTLYEVYGDKRILREQYESMKGWVGYIRARAKDEAIWNSGFHFGDWLALDAKEGSYLGATPNDFTATAFYAYSTRLLSKTAKVLGLENDFIEYESLYKKIIDAIKHEFFTPSGRLAVRTQTAHVLCLMFELVPEEYKKRTIDTLIELIKENGGHLVTGFLGTPYICHVLSDNDRLDEVYKLVLREEYPSWLYQVKNGATTIWEHWDGIKPDGEMWSADMNSFNHYAYGSVGDWLYRVAAGINTDEDEPGYKKIVIYPRPGGGLTWAKASYMSAFGRISTGWRIDDGMMTVEVTIPHNTKALVILENATQNSIKGDKAEFSDCGAGIKTTLGSGSYSFTYPVAWI